MTNTAKTYDELLDGLALIDAYNSNDGAAMTAVVADTSAASAVRATLKVVEMLSEITTAKPDTTVADAAQALRTQLVHERDRHLAAA